MRNFLFILHSLYVGQGDCTILEYKEDKDAAKKYLWCIDFGGNMSLTKSRTDVVKYIEKLGCKNKNTAVNIDNKFQASGSNNNKQSNNEQIEFNCILTHPHFDHYECLKELNQNFDINKFYYSNLYDDYKKVNFVDKYLNTLRYNKKVKEVVENFSREQKQQVFSDDIIFNDKNICIKVLWPTKGYKETNKDFNDNSMVLLITLLDSNKKIILMADAGVKAEKEIINKYPDLENVEIIKIGHHGNSSSSSQEFIDKMNPGFVINSTGPHFLTIGLINCHTSGKVMKAWQRVNNGNTKIYTTYEHGDIVIKYNPENKSFFVK